MSSARDRLLPLLSGLGVLVVGLAVIWSVDSSFRENARHDLRALVTARAAEVRAGLESELNRRLYLNSGLAAFAAERPEVTQAEFQRFAERLLEGLPGVRSLQLARDSTVSHIYPLAGNENALGLRLLEHPRQAAAAQRAIDTGVPVVAGPVDLVQGGHGLISRRPIYVTTPDGDSARYWGLATVLIDSDLLMSQAGLPTAGTGTPGDPVLFALRGQDAQAAQGGMIWGDAAVFSSSPVVFTVRLPGGSWQLAAVPSEGWDAPSPLSTPLRLAGLAFALLAAISTGVFFHNQRALKREWTAHMAVERILERKSHELQDAHASIQTLSGLLPICSGCKQIRDDQGLWNRIEQYIEENSDATFTHGLCPSCARDLYGDEVAGPILEKIEAERRQAASPPESEEPTSDSDEKAPDAS